MKKFTFKGRKHAVTATCLIAGMFVLTSAVYANYDDSRGYTNYKDAVKDLVLYQDNFTVDGEMSVLIDGKEMATMKGNFKLDNDDFYLQTVSEDSFSEGDNKYENIQVTKDGKEFSYYPKTNSYTISEASNDFRPDMSDPTMKKGVRFAELFADAMVGDLKNNFVLSSKEGDNRTYSVNVSGSQIPEVVNAGISLMFTAANNQDYSNYSAIEYENYQKTFAAYYEEQTGKKMTEDMYNEWNEEIEKINEDFYGKYEDVLEAKGDVGIVYVKADGTYEYYKTYDEYNKNVQSNAFNDRNIMKLLGNDPYIDSAACNFTLDKDGKIVSDEMEASMTGVDSQGKKHTITMKANYKVSDYGTTKVDAFDTAGKTKTN
ncbi:hypothetical protein [Aminipila sp.]|uniref:hypothetical protein n=1 Tax=Aminipila sp. TaxID=2060095 RepID=UPI00289FC921|nr:hypothetical protein [Aminipila sp.]